MTTIVEHSANCKPATRCTCGAGPQQIGVEFDPYVELKGNLAIVHVEPEYMVTFAFTDHAGARGLAKAIDGARISTDSWETRTDE